MSTKVMSMAAAHRIWIAHREIGVGTRLLADIRRTLETCNDPTPIDPLNRQRAFTLGVPCGNDVSDGRRILDVSPRLAAAVIEAHIAEKQRDLIEASLAARIELETEAQP